MTRILPFVSFGAWRKRRPRRVAVRAAWLDPDRYAGEPIFLDGVVHAFDTESSAPYFTLDAGPNRIGLQADGALLGPLTGRTVRATGHLTFKPGVGIFLAVDEIRARRR